MKTLTKDHRLTLGITYGEFVRNLFRPLAPASMLAHAAMGVVTEIRELFSATTAANAAEEAGDITFFCVAFAQCLPFQFSNDEVESATKGGFLRYCRERDINPIEIDGDDVEALMFDLSIEMLDAAKRYLAYDKAPTEEVCATLVGYAELVAGFAQAAHEGDGDQTQAIIDINVAKLQHRYKAGFSTEAAVNRDVAAEAEVIQRAVAG